MIISDGEFDLHTSTQHISTAPDCSEVLQNHLRRIMISVSTDADELNGLTYTNQSLEPYVDAHLYKPLFHVLVEMVL